MTEATEFKKVTGLEEQKTVGVSPWVLSLLDELGERRPESRWSYQLQNFVFDVLEVKESLWIVVRFPSGGEVAVRAAYCPDANLSIEDIIRVGDEVENARPTGFEIQLNSTVGGFRVQLEFPYSDLPLLRCKTSLTPSAPLFVPFWPRDVIPLGSGQDLMDSEGIIYASQVGARSGLLYFSLTQPHGGSVLYFQNLTSLNEYGKQTETSLAEVVGGEWPELGLALPAALEKPLEAGKEITLSDAFLIFSTEVPKDDLVMSRQFLELLAQVYLVLPRPDTEYIHWPELLDKSLHDLSRSPRCWSRIRQKRYLNAYVGDSETPPESMVQLTVLLPLLEFAEWSGKEIPLTQDILKTLPGFFDEKAGVLGRWLLSEANKLDGSEPQKKPEVMDSWYLYHSLLNISRLAIAGDKVAHKLFIDSLDYAIEVAHKFKYRWPVFYDLYTMEVLKAETEEGKGGEMDVAGQYVHLMMQARDLTKDDRYLEEAKRAAQSLKGLGFNLFYQANATLFAAGGLLRLWKATGDDLYLDLSYVCLANIFRNTWMWECEYGYAQHYRTFFALFPLKDAPYTAVYEELEGFAALHDYLSHYEGEMPEWLKILAAEFIRYILYKGSFYYPPLLPKEILAEKPRTGELDPELWIPLEDVYDGWEKAGQVGQEVYGAGLPFGIVPRHYWRVPDEKFLIYIDYPTQDFSSEEKGKATFRILGDPRLPCRLRLIPTGKSRLPDLDVQTERDGSVETFKGKQTSEGHLEYQLFGDRAVTIRWSSRKGESRKAQNEKNKQKGMKQ